MKQFSQFVLFLIIYFPVSCYAQSGESLKINWSEEYKWKVGSDQESDGVHVIELIPENETFENWTIMGNTMTMKGLANGLTTDLVMKMMFDQALANAPKAKLTDIERNDKAESPWILFTIEAPYFNDDKNPESQLFYIILDKQNLYSNFVALKKKTLAKDFILKWSAIFKASKIITK